MKGAVIRVNESSRRSCGRVWRGLLIVVATLLAGCRNIEDRAFITGQDPTFLYLPVVQENLPPAATTSYYLKTIDGGTLAVMGCQVGVLHSETQGPQDSGVILDFGTPTFLDGVYGATLFGFGPVTMDQIAVAVEYYAWGYYVCLGEDFQSHLWIGVGTNNYIGGSVTYNHAREWALMVNEINAWLVDNGYSGQVTAAGASDFELGWNTPEKTHSWLNGYDSANDWPLYNYGDAAGCPPAGQCGTASFPSWTPEDVWFQSWGAPPAFPWPLIYANSGVNATQWYLMSVYSYETHGGPMGFLGAITQEQACLQRPSPICSLLDNTPEEGWSQLYYLAERRRQNSAEITLGDRFQVVWRVNA